MNPRNVAALAELLEEFDRRTQGRFDSPHYLAEWLASRGVLVPSTVSDIEWHRVVAGDEGNRDVCIAALEGIASGGHPLNAPKPG